MSKDLYSEICVPFDIDSVENLVANRRNRLINRYRDSFRLHFLLRLFNLCLLHFFL